MKKTLFALIALGSLSAFSQDLMATKIIKDSLNIFESNRLLLLSEKSEDEQIGSILHKGNTYSTIGNETYIIGRRNDSPHR